MKNSARPFVKRVADMLLSGMALLILAPLMALVALTIRFSIGRPVLFRQTRPGYKAKPFTLLKFTTMTGALDARGDLLPDAERLTRIGSFLRAHGLDELPQMWNVLRGDMSLVGPRPLLMQYIQRYTPEQFRRHDMKPGVTGWVQVNGGNALTWPEKFSLDLWYVDNWSLSLDAWILLRTLWLVMKVGGIRHRGHVIMPEFSGNERDEL
jgi:sugar transferase EpsL